MESAPVSDSIALGKGDPTNCGLKISQGKRFWHKTAAANSVDVF